MARLTDAELNALKDIVKKRQAELASQRMQETAGKEPVATDVHVAKTVAELEGQASAPATAAVVEKKSEPIQQEAVVATDKPDVVENKSTELKVDEQDKYIEAQKNKASLSKNRVVRPRTGKKATAEVATKQSDDIQDQSETTKQPAAVNLVGDLPAQQPKQLSTEEKPGKLDHAAALAKIHSVKGQKKRLPTKQPTHAASPLLSPSVSNVSTTSSLSSHLEVDPNVSSKDTKNNLYKLLRTKQTETQSESTSSTTPSSPTTGSPLSSRESITTSSSTSSITSTQVHTGASDSNIGDLKTNLIKAVVTAEMKYREYHKDNNAAYTRNHKESHYSFFGWLRHREQGLTNADAFKKLMESKEKLELKDVISALDSKLRSSKTRYHRHSFGSYLLDEIKTEVLKFSPELAKELDTGPDDKYAYNNKNVTFAWQKAHEALVEKEQELAGTQLNYK